MHNPNDPHLVVKIAKEQQIATVNGGPQTRADIIAHSKTLRPLADLAGRGLKFGDEALRANWIGLSDVEADRQ